MAVTNRYRNADRPAYSDDLSVGKGRCFGGLGSRARARRPCAAMDGGLASRNESGYASFDMKLGLLIGRNAKKDFGRRSKNPWVVNLEARLRSAPEPMAKGYT